MRRPLLYTLLGLACLVTVLPLLYMVSLSLQTEAETLAADAVLWPDAPQWGNYAELFARAPFGDFIVNSLVVVAASRWRTCCSTRSSGTSSPSSASRCATRCSWRCWPR